MELQKQVDAEVASEMLKQVQLPLEIKKGGAYVICIAGKCPSAEVATELSRQMGRVFQEAEAAVIITFGELRAFEIERMLADKLIGMAS